LTLHRPTVRVVRLGETFNFSDLMGGSGGGGSTMDVTVDRFALTGGTVAFEGRALSEPQEWAAEQIEIEAQKGSTRRNDGTTRGTSVTAGAPSRIDIQNLRLYPIHLDAVVSVEGLDLSLARLYLPPDAPVLLNGGTVSSELKVALDAKAGVRADVTSDF